MDKQELALVVIDRLKKGTESKIYIWRPVPPKRRDSTENENE